ncbi:hypothetical protein [Agrococcus baldri]|uniref:Uncharacterized protein n=1 Tax=Agrococcus baldri TaxID=153730 RepID=A0AA87RGD7_9MICO|nr:hypothetical protein [Agrococcus baldri]GEK80139.1 hypothetical protein ABA31_14900 [Agrococcus baldri]
MSDKTVEQIAEQARVSRRLIMRMLLEQGVVVPASGVLRHPHVVSLERTLREGDNWYLTPSLSVAESQRAAQMMKHSLPEKLPELLRGLAARTGAGVVADIAREVLGDADPFFVWGGDRTDTPELVESADTLELFDLPAPRGVVAFRSIRRSGVPDVHVLFWRHGPESVSLATFELFADQSRAGEAEQLVVHRGRYLELLENDDWLTHDGDPTLLKFAMLWQPATAFALPDGAFSTSAAASSDAPPSADLDSIGLIPLMSTRRPASSVPREWQRKTTNRWMVRGHWRNQWYSSLQEHRPVWIEEHSAGDITQGLLPRSRVYVLP